MLVKVALFTTIHLESFAFWFCFVSLLCMLSSCLKVLPTHLYSIRDALSLWFPSEYSYFFLASGINVCTAACTINMFDRETGKHYSWSNWWLITGISFHIWDNRFLRNYRNFEGFFLLPWCVSWQNKYAFLIGSGSQECRALGNPWSNELCNVKTHVNYFQAQVDWACPQIGNGFYGANICGLGGPQENRLTADNFWVNNGEQL